MATVVTWMPIFGEDNAPTFDPAYPIQLLRFFEQLEALFSRCDVQVDADRKAYASSFVDADLAECWEALPEFSSATTPYSAFRQRLYYIYCVEHFVQIDKAEQKSTPALVSTPMTIRDQDKTLPVRNIPEPVAHQPTFITSIATSLPASDHVDSTQDLEDARIADLEAQIAVLKAQIDSEAEERLTSNESDDCAIATHQNTNAWTQPASAPVGASNTLKSDRRQPQKATLACHLATLTPKTVSSQEKPLPERNIPETVARSSPAPIAAQDFDVRLQDLEAERIAELEAQIAALKVQIDTEEVEQRQYNELEESTSPNIPMPCHSTSFSIDATPVTAPASAATSKVVDSTPSQRQLANTVAPALVLEASVPHFDSDRSQTPRCVSTTTDMSTAVCSTPLADSVVPDVVLEVNDVLPSSVPVPHVVSFVPLVSTTANRVAVVHHRPSSSSLLELAVLPSIAFVTRPSTLVQCVSMTANRVAVVAPRHSSSVVLEPARSPPIAFVQRPSRHVALVANVDTFISVPFDYGSATPSASFVSNSSTPPQKPSSSIATLKYHLWPNKRFRRCAQRPSLYCSF